MFLNQGLCPRRSGRQVARDTRLRAFLGTKPNAGRPERRLVGAGDAVHAIAIDATVAKRIEGTTALLNQDLKGPHGGLLVKGSRRASPNLR